MEIDLKLAERVMQAIVDAGVARPAQLELHTVLTSDLGLIGHQGRYDLAWPLILRFEVTLQWIEIREWQTIADVVRSVQGALPQRAAA